MIRVLHVISGLDQGGAEAMLMRLMKKLDRRSFSQSVVSLTSRGVYGDELEALGIPLHILGLTGFASIPGGLARLRRIVKAIQPDVVQTWLYHSDLLGLVAARMAGDAAVAWNVRCAGLGPGDVPRSTRWLTSILGMLSSRPDAVLFNSSAGRHAHAAIGYRPRRSVVIPNGFDLDERRPDPERRADFRSEIGVDNATFLVGMVARAHQIKNQSTFLTAAARLKEISPGIRFVLVGLNESWDNKSLVSDIDRLGLRESVMLLGLRQDIARVMAGLDCLVSTSTSEGFPNVLGEAMACGVPCVATDAGDSRVIVGDTGKIVAIGDVGGIVSGIVQLMDSGLEDRTLRSERCRQRIVDHFELSHVAALYADFYRELDAAQERGAPRPVGHRAEPSASIEVTPRYRFLRLGWAGRALVLAAVMYAAIFYTPLIWFAGDRLTLRDAPRQADAIVVFSGNGESSYINTSYQRRAVDAAGYYKAGFAPLLVISSGIAQTFAEVEIIRALLLSQGVPADAIHIVPEYPKSTRQNVELVHEVLKARGAKSILFITAPYHSRRASLIWRRVAPDVRVTTVPVVDTPTEAPQWRATTSQIETIAYEYLAIAYNWKQGWF